MRSTLPIDRNVDGPVIGSRTSVDAFLHQNPATSGPDGFRFIDTEKCLLSPVYSGWATRSLLKLYEVDANGRWLDYAQGNVDAINRGLRANYGYYRLGCGDSTELAKDYQIVDQAWMQQIQARLAEYR